MAIIHPTSVIEPGALLAEDVEIGPFCHIGAQVTLGAGTRVLSHVAIRGRTTLGVGNTVWPQATLGCDPQDLKYRGEDTELLIGDHNHIRESVSLHKGTGNGGGITRIGSQNLIMAYVHLGHDCMIGDNAVIANAVQLAGHVCVEDYAHIGGATAIHHFVTVGRYAFVGGMTRVVHDVPPFMVVEGNPARVRKINSVLMKRLDFPDSRIERIKTAFRRLYAHSENGQAVTNLEQRLEELEREFPDDWAIAHLAQTLRRSAVGVFGRHRESLRPDDRYANPAADGL